MERIRNDVPTYLDLRLLAFICEGINAIQSPDGKLG
jgi:hypothetical protein